jgi:(R,R)-butanediol dehydrogenase/meso-butanediol dehydrogenase/diacetyl reductase
MKALVLHASGDARIEQRPEPGAPGPGEVTLRVVRAGLCGTDASEYAAGPVMTPLTVRHPNSGVLGPVVLGHEFVGVVEQAGPAVERVRTGDRVAAGAGVWCGHCAWCRRGPETGWRNCPGNWSRSRRPRNGASPVSFMMKWDRS